MTTVPGTFLLRPTPGLTVDVRTRRLIGGSPQRILTFSPQGMKLVTGWFDGVGVGPEPAHRALARRLVEADLALPHQDRPPTEMSTVDVVIPVRNDPVGLAATLAALGATGTGVVRRIVIVDDGSEPAVDPAVGETTGLPVTLLRRSTSAGPGNARNLAVAEGNAPTIVFVDAGVIVTTEQVRSLTAELDVGETIAIAPRVRSEMGTNRLARYERTWSPLDLGAEGALVGHGRRVSYVPSTCLAVRRSALVEAGGFDPELRFGEDVDLVWRLGALGWVRYVPEIVVTHPPRPTLKGFAHQRFRYGTSAGPLARRHGWAVTPARLDSRSAATWAALLTGFRRPAALIAVSASAVYVGGLIRQGVPATRALRMVADGWIGTARGLSLATARTWWPLAVVAATRSRFRPALWLLVAGWLRRLARRQSHDQPGGPAFGQAHVVGDAVADLALGVLDDSAYGLGVWRGAVQARTVRPVLPRVPIGRGRGATGR